jgi:RES domain-containing protein
MPSGWRLVAVRYANDAFSGEGARLYGARWNSPGRTVVYLSEHRSLAALELFAHGHPPSREDRYAMIGARWDERFMQTTADAELPEDWRAVPPALSTTALGDQWIGEARSAVLAVPSVVVPAENNYLLNPAHPDFRHVSIGNPEPFTFDPRLLHS